MKNKQSLCEQYLSPIEAVNCVSILNRLTAQPPHITKDELIRLEEYIEKMEENSGNHMEVYKFAISVMMAIHYSLLAELGAIKRQVKSKGMFLTPKRKLE